MQEFIANIFLVVPFLSFIQQLMCAFYFACFKEYFAKWDVLDLFKCIRFIQILKVQKGTCTVPQEDLPVLRDRIEHGHASHLLV